MFNLIQKVLFEYYILFHLLLVKRYGMITDILVCAYLKFQIVIYTSCYITSEIEHLLATQKCLMILEHVFVSSFN
jgi:hypothetical protein